MSRGSLTVQPGENPMRREYVFGGVTAAGAGFRPGDVDLGEGTPTESAWSRGG